MIKSITSSIGLALVVAFLVASVAHLSAQVRVDISFKRKLFVKYEPLVAVVTINNLSGRPLLLENTDNHRWFGFNRSRGKNDPGSQYHAALPSL